MLAGEVAPKQVPGTGATQTDIEALDKPLFSASPTPTLFREPLLRATGTLPGHNPAQIADAHFRYSRRCGRSKDTSAVHSSQERRIRLSLGQGRPPRRSTRPRTASPGGSFRSGTPCHGLRPGASRRRQGRPLRTGCRCPRALGARPFSPRGRPARGTSWSSPAVGADSGPRRRRNPPGEVPPNLGLPEQREARRVVPCDTV
jgi:hypothetical protein